MLTRKTGLGVTEQAVHIVQKIEESPVKRVELNVDDWTIDSYSEALFNQYKFWCRSSAFDYIRQPNYAGFFDGWLRSYPMNEDGEKAVAADLIAKTNLAFGDELELLNVEVKCDRNKRYWTVKVTPRDTKSSLVGKSKDGSNLIGAIGVDSGFILAGDTTVENKEVRVSKADAEYKW